VGNSADRLRGGKGGGQVALECEEWHECQADKKHGTYGPELGRRRYATSEDKAHLGAHGIRAARPEGGYDEKPPV